MTGKKMHGRGYTWSPEEDEILRTHYPTMCAKDIAPLLGAGRSSRSVVMRCSVLGLRKTPNQRAAVNGKNGSATSDSPTAQPPFMGHRLLIGFTQLSFG